MSWWRGGSVEGHLDGGEVIYQVVAPHYLSPDMLVDEVTRSLGHMAVGVPGAQFSLAVQITVAIPPEYAEYVEEAAARSGIELRKLGYQPEP